MTADKLLELYSQRKNFSFIRCGQGIFNLVHDLRPDIANELTGTEFDCFYSDSKIEKFLEKVCEIW